jgi:hypothetical protein
MRWSEASDAVPSSQSIQAEPPGYLEADRPLTANRSRNIHDADKVLRRISLALPSSCADTRQRVGPSGVPVDSSVPVTKPAKVTVSPSEASLSETPSGSESFAKPFWPSTTRRAGQANVPRPGKPSRGGVDTPAIPPAANSTAILSGATTSCRRATPTSHKTRGTLNFTASNAADSTACRLDPSSTTFIHFYVNDPGMPFTRWGTFMAEAARLGRAGVHIHYGREAQYIYAVGTSNGGYQVRRAVESYPELFDGGVDWEGTFVDPDMPNLLTTLPAAILNFPDYVASGFNLSSTAAKNILAAGYPHDVKSIQGGRVISLWEIHYLRFCANGKNDWTRLTTPTARGSAITPSSNDCPYPTSPKILQISVPPAVSAGLLSP